MSFLRLFSFTLFFILPFGVMGSNNKNIKDDSLLDLPNLGKLSQYEGDFEEGYKILQERTESLHTLPDFEKWLMDPAFVKNLKNILKHSRQGALTFMNLLAQNFSVEEHSAYFQATYDQAKSKDSSIQKQFENSRDIAMGGKKVLLLMQVSSTTCGKRTLTNG